ncbi:MAG: patatin-like phospholipase family protein [Dermatophilus congolensis]|nr:patatin-like phospholipase family protein [Dermatophilus congolensis]
MRIALVLGSGGARGYAHIGVIQVLRENGHEIVAISGSSMGAMVGGLAAAGGLDEFTDWVTGLKQRNVLLLLDPVLGGPGVIRAERALSKVSGILGGVLIEDLPIPFVAVATDLEARREVWFRRGPVDAAVRASIAIPGVITPAMLGTRTLVDGGLLNPVPVDPLLGVDADITLAVSLNGPRLGAGLPMEGEAPAHGGQVWRTWLRKDAFSELERWSQRWRSGRGEAAGASGHPAVAAAGAVGGEPDVPVAQQPRSSEHGSDSAGESDVLVEEAVEFRDAEGHVGIVPQLPQRELFSPHENASIRNVVDVFTLSLEAVESMVGRYRMASSPPDVHIEVAADSCGTLDFHRAPEMIELGRRLAEDALRSRGLLRNPPERPYAGRP